MSRGAIMREAVVEHGFSEQRQPFEEVNVSEKDSTTELRAGQIPIPTHPSFQDLTGRRFGHLTVVAYAGRIGKGTGATAWICRCDCGCDKVTRASQLRTGNVTSCGCLRPDLYGEAKRQNHGKRNLPEYQIWAAMKDRCHNPRRRDWKHYGGRGVTVCRRWSDSFEAFYSDMGPRPSPKHEIDRIDNSKGYEPGNCRWATQSENRYGLVAPYLLAVNHGGDDDRSHSPSEPLATLTTKTGHSLVMPFLTKYNGTGGAHKDRFGLAMVSLLETMQQLGVVDIGFRMLEPDELARAQGFPEKYFLHGSKAEMVRQIGNSVSPPVAAAICRTIQEAA